MIRYIYPSLLTLSNVTGNETVNITFTTDKLANAAVEYGSTLALGTSLVNSSNLTSHFFNISNLVNNTQYYYNITVCNTWNVCNETGPYSFTTNQTVTDTTPPVIVSLSNITTNQTVTITFDSDDVSNATLEYGTALSLGSAASGRSTVGECAEVRADGGH